MVLSVQGLILGTQYPYFLEAGYEKLRYFKSVLYSNILSGTTQGDHAAILYNETAYLLSRQAIINIIKDPPKHFKVWNTQLS